MFKTSFIPRMCESFNKFEKLLELLPKTKKEKNEKITVKNGIKIE